MQDFSKVRYLVFGVGGANGFAHVGAWKALETEWARHHMDMQSQVLGAGGASIGAIIALAVVLGFRAVEFEQFADEMLAELEPMLSAANVLRLYTHKGMISPEPLALFTRQMLKRKLGFEDITFSDLARHVVNKRLVVSVTNHSRMRNELLTLDNSPDLYVWKAVAMSCLIPLVFDPMVHHGDEYVDGGVTNSLPYEPFPRDKTIAVYLQKMPDAEKSDVGSPLDLGFIARLVDGYETATRNKLESDDVPCHVIRIGLPVSGVGLVISHHKKKLLCKYGELVATMSLHPEIAPAVLALLRSS